MKCYHCGRDVPYVKKTCPYCGSFMVGYTVNNATGEYGYRDEDGMFYPCNHEKSKESSQKMNSIWIARDKNGLLYAYKDKPVRDERTWTCQDSDLWYQLDESWFPCLNWEDDPIELVIKEKAINALDKVLDNWVHGGDEDCIIAEFEEELSKEKEDLQ